MTNTQFTKAQLKYIAALANPEERRSKTQLAKDVGVKRQTLYNWEDLDGFWVEVKRLIEKNSNAALGAVWRNLTDVATGNKGKPCDWIAAAKLFFQMRGDYVDKSEVNQTGPPPEVNISITQDKG